MITAHDIRAEHEAAVAGLTQEQRRALGRLDQVREKGPLNSRAANENLLAIFQAEAARRNDDAWRRA